MPKAQRCLCMVSPTNHSHDAIGLLAKGRYIVTTRNVTGRRVPEPAKGTLSSFGAVKEGNPSLGTRVGRETWSRQVDMKLGRISIVWAAPVTRAFG